MLGIKHKDRPTDQWIKELDARYKVEATVREALVWKLAKRNGPTYHAKAVSDIGERLETFLRAHIEKDFRISNLKRLPGGGSKEHFVFDLAWYRGEEARKDRLILRMNSGEGLVETHRLREFQLLRAFEGVVPIPRAHWLDADGSLLGQPGLICSYDPGRAQPSERGKANGVGIDYGIALRRKLAPQFVDILAKIHSFDWKPTLLSAFDVPRPGTTDAVEWQIAWWERVYEEDTLEEHPVIPLVADWLKKNRPVADDIVVSHGDFRSGNFLFDEDGKITVMLDWELGHLGDPHDDLSWVLMRSWGHYDEKNNFQYCGLMSKDYLVREYESRTGYKIDQWKLDYYLILNTFKLGIIGFATGPRIVYDGQSHQDIIINLLTAVGHVCLDDLYQLLKEVSRHDS